MKIIIYIFTFLLCFLPGNTVAENIPVARLTTENGLSNYNVISMYQDERGYIWLGTRNGVNLYNGKSIQTFKNKKGDKNSLIYNNVTAITGNGNGEVYFMTPNGISVFNIKEFKFSTVTQKNVSAMFYYKDLYYAIRNNIYKYSSNHKSELVYELPNNYSSITSLYISEKEIYIGTEENGLYRLSTTQVISNVIPNINVSSILKDSKGTCWISSVENGLYRIKDNQVSNISSTPKGKNAISSNFVRHCCEDRQGKIWIGTFKGIDIYDYSTDTFSNYMKENDGHNISVWYMLCDQQGSMWIGTYFKGVYRINTSNTYRYFSPHILTSLRFPVSCIQQDKENNLWIGTSGGGMNKYNLHTQKAELYSTQAGKNSISHNNINAICYDSTRNTLWIGTNLGGLNRLNLKNNSIKVYRHNANNENSLLSDIVKDIAIHEGKLYIATQKGICSFDPAKERFEKMFQIYPHKISYTNGVFIDSRHTLWIYGERYGVYAYNLNTQKLIQYRHDPNKPNTICGNTINTIYEDRKGHLWFCSDVNGIDQYIPESDTFINFDKGKNGLISNTACSIQELSDQRFLITTDEGISILDADTKSCTNYDEKSGLPKAVLNAYALYIDPEKNIFAGSANGLVSFRETDLNNVTGKFSILPYRLFVNGKEVEVGDNSHILHEDLSHTKSITLNSEQRLINIEYSTTNYLYTENNLEYHLEGFSNGWTDMRGENTIGFTNLPPGSYTLMVRPSHNPSGIPASSLEIRILPPPYKTGWAYCLYTIFFFGVVLYLIRSYSNRIQLKASLKYEKKHSEDIEKLNQSKIHFFTNIVHEFRTPLTLIIGQMEILLQSKSLAPTAFGKVSSIYNNSLQLKDLIDELLEFHKQEQGHMTLHIRKHNIADLLYNNYLLFQNYSPQSNITLTFQSDSDYIELWFDARQMQKVINNLLSIAFKNTDTGGKINISVRERVDEIIIEVNNTGRGIAPNELSGIFDRYHSDEDSSQAPFNFGTNIGLTTVQNIINSHHGKIEVFSKPDVGTTFVIKLKAGNKHFTPKELLHEELPDSIDSTADIPQAIQERRKLEETTSDSNRQEKEFKVLIVEKNEKLTNMLADLLSPIYEVITASDGEEGWERIRTVLPDIVIMDATMPKMSGIELCKRIKGDIEVCHIPVILLTADSNLENNIEGLNAGADDYVSKPFNTHILLAQCNRLINNRLILQEKFSGKASISPQALTTNTFDKNFMDNILKIIEKNMQEEDFSVDMLAAEAGIARTKLYKRIKSITGKTPYDLILSIRLKHASTMLKNNPELNIADISYKLGFTSARLFSKHFKDRYKVTPQEFRKKINP